ncbi:MAG: 16S rRNA (guanine(527)-N(7))-methyltransferase RsmG [Tepidamorphaceae bacterium]
MSSDRARAEELLADLGVSRETRDRLEVFVSLLVKWQKAQNLVGPATLRDVWTRHIADSLQLLPYIQERTSIADIGSGAGFPGLVLAIAFADADPAIRPAVHLIESNRRKAAFLRSAARETGARAVVHSDRVETVLSGADEGGVAPDIITARALASLQQLFEMTQAALKNHVVCLFHKGRGFEMELSEARRYWNFEADIIPSRVAEDSVILRVSQIAQV